MASSSSFLYSDLLLPREATVLCHQLHQSSGFDLGFWSLWKSVFQGRAILKEFQPWLEATALCIFLCIPLFLIPAKIQVFPEDLPLSITFLLFSSYPCAVLSFLDLLCSSVRHFCLDMYLTVTLNLTQPKPEFIF